MNADLVSFSSIDDVTERFAAANYVCNRETATAVFLMTQLQRPLLVEGPPGVGKTELAKVLSETADRQLIRLQCYEGLDEAKALYEWEYSKQLLYVQMLKDKLGNLLAETASLHDAVTLLQTHASAFFSRHFLLPRPLLQAILAPQPTVLLIDEIDRADQEFEAFLLEVLSDFQVSIPELGTLRAEQRPLVVLTSNATRSLSEALKRRCFYLYIDHPAFATELQIVQRKVPDIDNRLATQIVQYVQRVRQLNVRKTPSISETLDWALALVVLGAGALSREVLVETLNILLKDKDDIAQALQEAGR
ncbi:MAG: ATPase [Candidatus Entotheonella factor]|uniref:ATPase n=1 Tax=Entotheonella factor TaxID=1429438 RepID=W4LF84_ENTF1|nr:MoxR family ATPase [Candidatus Entotheonella palauensis]ETW96667.1 MAG: ATPase [Candidatus Entotheonella factor]